MYLYFLNTESVFLFLKKMGQCGNMFFMQNIQPRYLGNREPTIYFLILFVVLAVKFRKEIKCCRL